LDVKRKDAFDVKSWTAGLQMLGHIFTCLTVILNSAPVGEFIEKDQIIYGNLRAEFLKWSQKLQEFISLDYEFLTTLAKLKSTYPPQFKHSRVIPHNYISAYLDGLSLSSSAIAFIESYRGVRITSFGGLTLGGIVGYVGAGFLTISAAPVALIGALIGGGVSYYLSGRSRRWLESVQSEFGSLKMLKKSDFFLMISDKNSDDDLATIVDACTNFTTIIKSQKLSLK